MRGIHWTYSIHWIEWYHAFEHSTDVYGAVGKNVPKFRQQKISCNKLHLPQRPSSSIVRRSWKSISIPFWYTESSRIIHFTMKLKRWGDRATDRLTEVKTTINMRKQGSDNCLGQVEYINLKKEDGWRRWKWSDRKFGVQIGFVLALVRLKLVGNWRC